MIRWPASALPRKIAQDLRASYWFTPASMVILALLAAVGTEQLDRWGVTAWVPRWYYGTTADAARSVLTVIASASIGAAGVMFSMTVVAVSFASTNFGPRLIRNFMQDRGVQVSLGTLLSTFVFALIILRGIRGGQEGAAMVPALSVTCALALALVSVAVMIYFVHHIPELISLENIAAALGCRLLQAIDEMPRAAHPTADGPDDGEPVYAVRLDSAGFLQAVNCQGLADLADRSGMRLRIRKWPGDFVAPHMAVADLRGPEAPSDGLRADIADCFALGSSRTEAQNPLFIAKQLTEIIARALSPGVNDPFTAMTCLNWLHAALHRLAERGPVSPVDPDGLDQSTPFSFVDMLAVAHEIPRAYLADDAATAVHAYGLLLDLIEALPPGPRRSVVLDEARTLLAEARARQPHSAQIAALPAPPEK
ncbi:MAG: DUF2254 domain-containing protein [Rhodobacteraceae bacterium]|nr:DUF2254 domain-containing protein [Paracoccaceae bacterium]